MTRTFFGAFALASLFAMASACGGRESSDGTGSGNSNLGGADGEDASTGGSTGTSDLGEWPWGMWPGPIGVDGAVLTAPLAGDDLNVVDWMAWWKCGDAICTQNLQVNAECDVYWVEGRTDETTAVFDAHAHLGDAACTEIRDAQPTFEAMVSAPDAKGGDTAEELLVVLGPSPGTRTLRRIEGYATTGEPFGHGRKLLFMAYGALPSGKSALHFPGGAVGP